VSWSEDRLHRWLAQQDTSPLLRGSAGHDASVLKRPLGREVLCTDQVILGVHCEVSAPPRAVGRKAAARALSDLAATAASPRALLLAVRAPASCSERTIQAWIRGVQEEADRAGAWLCGGDLACADGPASLCVTAVGDLTSSGRPPGRDRARPGDYLALTGPVGGSRLGRHLRIQPRIEAGQRLHQVHGAKAMMDVSDGLAWDLYRLCRASGVRGVLEGVPLHRDAHRAGRISGCSAISHGMHDGEDHELLVTLSERGLRSAQRDGASCLSSLSVIGRVTEGLGLILGEEVAGGSPRPWSPDEGGWRHG